MVRRRRDQGDAWDGVTGLRDDLVHLITRQLTTFTRFSTLGDLDLDLIGVHQILRGDTETAGSDLLDGRAERQPILTRCEASGILATLSGVAASMYLVHGHGHGLVCLLADRAKTHRSGHEATHDGLFRLHLLQGDGFARLEGEEVTQEDRFRLVINGV